MIDLKAHLHRLRGHLKRLLESPTSELSRWGRLAVYQIRLWRFCGRQLRRDRLLTVAGDLAFKTLLSVIPLLVIFLLVINFFARTPETGQQALEKIFEVLNLQEIRIVRESEEIDLARMLDGYVSAAQERISAAAAVGIVFLFFLAMNVLGSVESAMNRIWQAPQRRPFWRKAAMFWLILTVGPAAVALAVYAAGYIDQEAKTLGIPAWLDVAARWAVGLAAVWFVLFILYKLLPHLEVRAHAALTGALVAGTVWHVVGKNAFEFYIQYAVGYQKVYGNLAVVPLFFIWIYVTWILVLFGCELAYVVQNFKDLARAEAEQAERERSRFLAADFVALAAASLVARRFRDGAGATPLDLLVDATGAGRTNLQELIGRMEAAGLLARAAAPEAGEEGEAAYLPARPAEHLRVSAILEAARAYVPSPLDAEHVPLHRHLRAVYDGLERGRFAAEPDLTLADLLDRAEAGPAPGAPADEEAGR